MAISTIGSSGSGTTSSSITSPVGLGPISGGYSSLGYASVGTLMPGQYALTVGGTTVTNAAIFYCNAGGPMVTGATAGAITAYTLGTISGSSKTGTVYAPWLPQSSPTTSGTPGIAFVQANGYLILRSATNTHWKSTDGLTWTQITGLSGMSAIAYGNATYVSVGGNGTTGYTFTSTDTTTWTSRTAPGVTIPDVVYGNSLFVAVNGTGAGTAAAYTSPDGITWTARNLASGNSGTNQSIAYSGSLFVIVNNAGQTVTSSNGTTWTVNAITGSPAFKQVIWDGTQFVATTAAGNILASTDGTTWTTKATIYQNPQQIAYGNGLYIAFASTSGTNHFWTSTDLTTWSQRAIVQSQVANTDGQIPRQMTYFGGKFWVYDTNAVGNGRVVASANGILGTPFQYVLHGTPQVTIN